MPAFCPWNREEYLKRLLSFRRIRDWYPKPDEINEVQWANRGWRLAAIETIQCDSCQKRMLLNYRIEIRETEIMIPLEDEEKLQWREKIEKALIVKYGELIISAHEDHCPWKTRGCDGNRFLSPSGVFFRLILVSDHSSAFSDQS